MLENPLGCTCKTTQTEDLAPSSFMLTQVTLPSCLLHSGILWWGSCFHTEISMQQSTSLYADITSGCFSAPSLPVKSPCLFHSEWKPRLPVSRVPPLLQVLPLQDFCAVDSFLECSAKYGPITPSPTSNPSQKVTFSTEPPLITLL